MEKILFLDATVREDSRTLIMANRLLSKLSGEITHVKLSSLHMPVLDKDTLAYRIDCCQKRDFSDPLFDNAKLFKEADVIVVAAPFWDYSFPSTLKSYIESVCIINLTFSYNEKNLPVSHCKAKKLFYVSSAGNYVDNFDLGFGYVKTVTENFFGIKNFKLFAVDGLDLYGNDSERILQKSLKEIDNFFE